MTGNRGIRAFSFLAWHLTGQESAQVDSTLKSHLGEQYDGRYDLAVRQADGLPLEDESLDALLTFNAVHHLPLQAFLKEACRVMRPGSHLLIYTRFRSQNARNIWGQYFPQFVDKEDRLYGSTLCVRPSP